MSASFATVVTGAQGFVGRSLVPRLGPGVVRLAFGTPSWHEDLERAPLAGATIFHLAARAHAEGRGSEAQYEADNAGKTRALAALAARRGARRLVYLSTVKVLGEETAPGRPFTAQSLPHPADAYGRSKWAAEQALAEFAAASALEVAIVRPPLLYGRGARGNLRSLLALADSSLPLPLAGLENRRSFLHVEDLCDLLHLCASDGRAAGGTFLAAHAQPASTTQLVGGLRRVLGRPERLFALPAFARALAEGVPAVGPRVRRLTRSLEVDPSATREALGWQARRGLDAALADLAAGRREDAP